MEILAGIRDYMDRHKINIRELVGTLHT